MIVIQLPYTFDVFHLLDNKPFATYACAIKPRVGELIEVTPRHSYFEFPYMKVMSIQDGKIEVVEWNSNLG